jgi:hypothetical protein
MVSVWSTGSDSRGRPRLTADVDITAEIRFERLDNFLEAMKRHGFKLRFDDHEFVNRTRVYPFLHDRTGVPLDVVLAGPGLEEEFLDRAINVQFEGTAVPVISPEDLIVTKVLAGRSKDIEDVRGVLRERASLSTSAGSEGLYVSSKRRLLRVISSRSSRESSKSCGDRSRRPGSNQRRRKRAIVILAVGRWR